MVNGKWNTVHKRAKGDGAGKVCSILPISAKNREFLASDIESCEFWCILLIKFPWIKKEGCKFNHRKTKYNLNYRRKDYNGWFRQRKHNESAHSKCPIEEVQSTWDWTLFFAAHPPCGPRWPDGRTDIERKRVLVLIINRKFVGIGITAKIVDSCQINSIDKQSRWSD